MQINFDKGFSAHFDKTHERFLHILSVIYFLLFSKLLVQLKSKLRWFCIIFI